MSTVLAFGKRFSVEDYKARPESFNRLLSQAKEGEGFALCQCTEPHPKLVIRSRRSPGGRRNHLATWPNQGHEHHPSCVFFVSDGEYLDVETRRDHECKAAADKLKGELETMHGILRHFFMPASKGRGDYKGSWADVHSHIDAYLRRVDRSTFPLASLIYPVPPFQNDRKNVIEAGWTSFCERFQGSLRNSRVFMVLGEVKSVESLDGSVATLLRHHRTPMFMSKDLAAALANAYPEVDGALTGKSTQGRVLGLFQAEMTRLGNLWVSDAALMLVSQNYSAITKSEEPDGASNRMSNVL